MIGYWPSAGADAGYTQAGTWVSYNDEKSIAAITKYTLDKKLGGMFIFDTSMDTVNAAGRPTFGLMNQIAQQLGGHPAPSPTPAPAPTPVPSGTCKSVNPAVSDAWCNENCHAATPFCPPADCKCA